MLDPSRVGLGLQQHAASKGIHCHESATATDQEDGIAGKPAVD